MNCFKGWLLAPLFMCGVAAADTVVLKDGDRLEGIVTERGDEVELRMDMGTVTFAKEDVASIERGGTALAELEARAAKLKAEDVEGHYRLGLDAEHRGLGSFARAMYRATIAVAPDHKGARAALGYRLHEGKWMTEDEFMTSQGYLKREGQWVTAEVARTLDEAEAKRRAGWEERQRRENDERRIAALERQVAESRAAEAERAKAREERPIYPTFLPV